MIIDATTGRMLSVKARPNLRGAPAAPLEEPRNASSRRGDDGPKREKALARLMPKSMSTFTYEPSLGGTVVWVAGHASSPMSCAF